MVKGKKKNCIPTEVARVGIKKRKRSLVVTIGASMTKRQKSKLQKRELKREKAAYAKKKKSKKS